MTNEEYIKEVLKTESCDLNKVRARLSKDGTLRLLHAVLGMCTESGEAVDMLKKHLFYGKPLDEVNMIEELGDLLYYVSVACDVLGVSIEEVQKINISKLRKRYGSSFTAERAIERDLDSERKILEQVDFSSGC